MMNTCCQIISSQKIYGLYGLTEFCKSHVDMSIKLFRLKSYRLTERGKMPTMSKEYFIGLDLRDRDREREI